MRNNSTTAASNSNSTVMSEEINDSQAGKTLEEKILKLKELIEDYSTSSNQNQLDKCEKLQQKLRYLEFYQSYDLGACPESWKCSDCKAINVDKKVTLGYDRVMVNLPNRKVVTVKQTIIKCEKSNKKDHYKEWETEEKLKPETRNSIRRDFLALIRKERELRCRQKSCSTRSAVMTTVDQPAQAKIRNKNTTNLLHSTQQLQTDNNQDELKEIQSNFHGENCKTCKRMMSLMGTVLPHPANH